MDELQRQAWLKQMGLTPWVAVRPLPGAPPAPELAWPARAQAAQSRPAQSRPAQSQPVQSQPAQSRPGATAGPAASASARVDTASASAARAPAPQQPPRTSPATTASRAPERPATTAAVDARLRFTLQACPVGDVWLVAAQHEADLPDFTPPELQLFRSLLQVFRARPGKVRKFEWPVGTMAQDESEAPVWFQGCLEMMAEKSGGRVLLCAPEALTRTLLGGERFQLVETAGTRLLAVSSLAEMLEDPVTHKRQSWQAMVGAGFHA